MSQCTKCKHIFSQKSHLIAHEKRKKPCNEQLSMDELVDIRARALLDMNIFPQPKVVHPISDEQKYFWSPSMLDMVDIEKPPIKWVGGKTQIIKEVIQMMPRKMDTYFEPFLGGGSVLLAVLGYVKAGTMQIKKFRACDINPNVIALYKNIQNNVDDLLTQLKLIVDTYNGCPCVKDANRTPKNHDEAVESQEAYYYWMRRLFNGISAKERLTPLSSAVFVFLNKTSFRGVYREGPHGFNVPFGHYKNPSVYSEEDMRNLSELIQGVEFVCQKWEETVWEIRPNDFVYLDPPYAPSAKNSFVSYTANGFKKEDHKELFKACQHLPMLMSNSDVDLVNDAFPSPPYEKKVLSCKRSINSKDPGERENEVLIRSIPLNTEVR